MTHPTVQELEEKLDYLAGLIDECPLALEIFDRVDQMLTAAKARSTTNAVERARAIRAPQRSLEAQFR